MATPARPTLQSQTSTDVPSLPELFDKAQLFQELGHRDERTRKDAALRLHRYVLKTAQQLEASELEGFMNLLCKDVADLLQSNQKVEKLGGIAAVAEIIKIEHPGVTTPLIINQFAQYFKVTVLPPTTNDPAVFSQTAVVVGKLARKAGTMATRFVEMQCDQAVDWLQSSKDKPKSDGVRLCASLLLHEISQAQPTEYFKYIPQVLEHIFVALFDSKPTVRVAAQKTLSSTLALWQDRALYPFLYGRIEKGLNAKKDDVVHGALLAACSFVELTGDYLKDTYYFDVVCDSALELRRHRSPLVQRELLILLPKLAANCPTKFVSYQNKAAPQPFARGALDFILAAINRDKDKAAGLNALGKLAAALGSELHPYLTDVRHVLGDLRSLLCKAMVTRNTNDAVLAAACLCVGYLARAMVTEIKRDLTRPHAKDDDERSLLDLLFDLRLTKSLVKALVMITDSFVWLENQPPAATPTIDDGIRAATVKRRLLDLLCTVIQGAPYRHPGNPNPVEVSLITLPGPPAPRSRRTSVAKEGALTPTSTPKFRRASRFAKDAEPVRTPTSVAALVLALDTLRTYNFHEFVLTTLARDGIAQYLSHSNDEVREAAGLTCAALVVPQIEPQVCARVDPLAVAEVLSQLLTNAISERKAGIRRRILQALPRATDTYLARAETLQLLFVCLHDRDHQTQLTALEVVGRLCDLNPAYVIPALRRQLQNILNSFVLTESATAEEFNSRLLSHLISVAPRVVAPYVDAVMKALLPRLDHSNEAIQVAALGAVGALSVFSGLQLDIHLAVIMPVLLNALKDQVSQRRRLTALRVLGQLARGTTYVTVPYEDYPSLMKGLYTCYTEGQTQPIRLEAARVLGVLGALDPHREREASGTAEAEEQALQAKMDGQQGPQPSSQHATANAPEEQQFDVGSEEYYADIVIRELYQTAYSPAMDKMLEAVGQALGMVVINMKLEVVRYLPMIVPAYLHMVEYCNPTGRHKMFKEISTLIDTFGEHVRPYMDDIIHCLTKHWFPLNEVSARALSGNIHPVARAVIRSSMQALGRSFKKYVPGLLAHIMAVIPLDQTDGRVITVQGLDAISLLGALVEDRVYPVVRALVLVFAAYVGMPANVRRQALNTLELLMVEIPLGDQASGVFNSLIRVIRHEPSIRSAAITALRPLIVQLGPEFESRGHKRALLKLLDDVEFSTLDRDVLVSLAETGTATQLARTPGKSAFKPLRDVYESNPQKSDRKLTESVVRLCRLAGSSKNFDWQAWIKKFCVTLVKHSKSHTLRACQFLASKFDLFARRIFNAAFVSTWKELSEIQRREMADALQNAMYADHVFMQMMLNVAEFMSHSFGTKNEPLLSLPFSTTTLGTMALDCHAYAKALRYKEDELRLYFDMADLNAGVARLPVAATPDVLQAVEDLIEITQSLQQAEAAQGVLTFVRLQTDLSAQSTIKPSWYEKLGEWDKALTAYSNQVDLELQDGNMQHKFELEVRVMVCLDNLGKWDVLQMELDRAWHIYTEDERRDVAPLGCSAACGMAQWDGIAAYLQYMPPEDPLTHFYAAVYAVHIEDHNTAHTHIELSRTLLHPTLSTLWGESYSRGYSHVVTLQRLAELEEVMQYKQLDHDPAAQDRIRQMWNVRLNGCQSNPAVWQRVLEVRSLVLEPAEDARMWLKYASLCRKASGLGSAQNYSRIGLDRSHNTLVSMLGTDPSLEPDQPIPMNTPSVTYAYIKHVWVSGERDEAISHLYSLIDCLAVSAQNEPSGGGNPEYRRLLARCYHKLGLWKAEPHLSSAGTVNSDLTDEMMDSIIESFRYATIYDRGWYKAWHSWAYMNYEAVKHFQGRDKEQRYLAHSIKSIKGFFNSIALSQHSNLQDTLRLLTLLFTHGCHVDVVNVFAEGLGTVSIDTWLQVIPQLIARIQIQDQQIRSLLTALLLQVGRKHAQALVFPLTVAAQNHKESAMRRDAAKNLLNHLRQHSHQLVEQAIMVADELIRVAVLWEEMWFEGIEEASKFYTDRQVDAMFAVLMPLHQQLHDATQDSTVRELAFLKLYGKDLRDAYEWLRKYQRTEDKQDITAAWDQYFHVYRAISKGLDTVNTLELKEVSPRLLEADDLELVVPGTYDHNEPEQVTICRFTPQLRVIRSKQRPRRLTVQGSDGEDHEYLLKAHEDLRQDERVMQLFSLVNVLLAKDTSTSNKHLHIFTYFVLPLSPKLGLIQWVPTCDTMHSLIREHRERTNILLNKELRMMLQMTSNMDQLTLIQKVEVFRHGLSQTKGDDLARILWQRSSSSEEWLERRGNFIRSLAVMSMVGYVLGLGDRHPSNLMIDRKTGGVMHVDFGDCFEVAINRPKYPERVPFRLTRMLVSAMEVSGVHGTYSITCENTMSVLRNNSDSVMAVLEAFVHDPLIDWFTKSRPDGDRMGEAAADMPTEEPNEKAMEVIERVKDKLSGTDFPATAGDMAMDVSSQVTRLIRDATMHENLCQHYTGWCPFW
eukprot:m.285189 g.285189  ORF g.285189 m.285189 type:complete len:2476 (+) comp17770_c0_seq3:155-7582(+)